MGEVARKALPLGDEVVAFDCTNFFPWIDSGNNRPQMPRRGHNKAHRYDLRQVGLALATTVHSEMPLFHHVYAGNSPDVTVFREDWPRLEERFGSWGWARQPRSTTPAMCPWSTSARWTRAASAM